MAIIEWIDDKLIITDKELDKKLIYKNAHEALLSVENIRQKLVRFIEDGVEGFEGKKWLCVSMLIDPKDEPKYRHIWDELKVKWGVD